MPAEWSGVDSCGFEWSVIQKGRVREESGREEREESAKGVFARIVCAEECVPLCEEGARGKCARNVCGSEV